MNGYNFTDRVRKVLQMAREEGARLHHEYVGTEHILLGLIREGEGVAVAVLINLNVDLEDVQHKIEETVEQGKAAARKKDELPYTSRAKKVLELAMSEARELNHDYVGTEHLLLGLLREEKGVAAQVLKAEGVDLLQARTETLRLLGNGAAPAPLHTEDRGGARLSSRFPIRRMRRLRRTPALRRLVQETRLAPSQFVWPLFVTHGEGVRREVGSLPGVFQTSVDELVKDAERAAGLGLGGIILFGLPAAKDPTGSEAYDDQGIVQQAIRAVKRAKPDLLVMGDVCLCEYTDHGHCGVIKDGEVDNDASVELLAQAAVSQARAGADVVAPSDMMDGRVAGIRKALDAAGFTQTPILSYAAKFASAFYGPFREAAGSTPQFGDRQGYQMAVTNGDEAMEEIRLDLNEGADMIMVKPALPCLDVIRRARDAYGVPLGAYQVSGEYAMIKAAAARGMLDEQRAMWESLYAIRRAGADFVLTYFATTAAELL